MSQKQGCWGQAERTGLPGRLGGEPGAGRVAPAHPSTWPGGQTPHGEPGEPESSEHVKGIAMKQGTQDQPPTVNPNMFILPRYEVFPFKFLVKLINKARQISMYSNTH